MNSPSPERGLSRAPFARRRAALALALSLSLPLALACGGCLGPVTDDTPLGAPIPSDHDRLTVTVSTASGAIARGDNELAIEVRNPDGTPGQLFRVDGRMPAHGHTAESQWLEPLGDGHYVAHGFAITMPGVWELTLSLSHTGATTDDTATLLEEVQ